MPKCFLVTGGAGFIGSNFVEHILGTQSGASPLAALIASMIGELDVPRISLFAVFCQGVICLWAKRYYISLDFY